MKRSVTMTVITDAVTSPSIYNILIYYMSIRPETLLNIYKYIVEMFSKNTNHVLPSTGCNQSLYQCASCYYIIPPSTIIYRGYDLSFCSTECRESFNQPHQ